MRIQMYLLVVDVSIGCGGADKNSSGREDVLMG